MSEPGLCAIAHGIISCRPLSKKAIDMKKKIFIIIFAAFVMTGCNTVSGVGKDIQKAGEDIENAAKK